MLIFIIFLTKIEKENQVIQSPELNQSEVDWFDLVQIWLKIFMNLSQMKPKQSKLIGSDLFFPKT